ncbi:cobalt-precorrin 5A hydrolase [Halanaerobacter jeridensis]|uniref:Cobalt-precorrin 5A hydrolase n=1 Tax=Halanaerobacter jeridensis TaxID=706427 RepID=A0A939BSG5_9FIRM|nr:cobalt-precorrin 5A hydrolase [Halanaerobacter jeridensis]MBM7557121.1 cobalt-precorrin 5A hydrolase [Halanaerobacter jeridensis]
MNLAVIALTSSGEELALKLEEKLSNVDLYIADKLNSSAEVNEFDSSLQELVAELFFQYDGLIFIMSLGIVVRVLAPYIEDKREDPAVVTIDETGANVISTLSGHLGGANQLTAKIAEQIKANPVITTATDCQDKLAFDLLAQQLNCEIIPFDNLKLANAALVNEQRVNIFSDLELDLDVAENVDLFSLDELGSREGFPVIISNQRSEISVPYIQLVPQNIVLGIGCRKGVSVKQVETAINLALQKLNLAKASIKNLATIDLKQDEAGLRETAKKLGVELEIIAREEIEEVDFDYTTSEFVKEQIGVGGVCEPTALLSAEEGELLLDKTSKNGVTVAVVKDNYM